MSNLKAVILTILLAAGLICGAQGKTSPTKLPYPTGASGTIAPTGQTGLRDTALTPKVHHNTVKHTAPSGPTGPKPAYRRPEMGRTGETGPERK